MVFWKKRLPYHKKKFHHENKQRKGSASENTNRLRKNSLEAFCPGKIYSNTFFFKNICLKVYTIWEFLVKVH